MTQAPTLALCLLWQRLCEQEMVVRVAKHELNRYLREIEDHLLSLAISHFLNCLFGDTEALSGGVDLHALDETVTTHKSVPDRHGDSTLLLLSGQMRLLTIPASLLHAFGDQGQPIIAVAPITQAWAGKRTTAAAATTKTRRRRKTRASRKREHRNHPASSSTYPAAPPSSRSPPRACGRNSRSWSALTSVMRSRSKAELPSRRILGVLTAHH